MASPPQQLHASPAMEDGAGRRRRPTERQRMQKRPRRTRPPRTAPPARTARAAPPPRAPPRRRRRRRPTARRTRAANAVRRLRPAQRAKARAQHAEARGVQWQEWAQSRRRCGRGEPSSGADVGGVIPPSLEEGRLPSRGARAPPQGDAPVCESLPLRELSERVRGGECGHACVLARACACVSLHRSWRPGVRTPHSSRSSANKQRTKKQTRLWTNKRANKQTNKQRTQQSNHQANKHALSAGWAGPTPTRAACGPTSARGDPNGTLRTPRATDDVAPRNYKRTSAFAPDTWSHSQPRYARAAPQCARTSLQAQPSRCGPGVRPRRGSARRR